MKKLILTCACGQRIQLPRNAVGKTGVCPTCGLAIPITKDNTKPLTAKQRQRARIFNTNSGNWQTGEQGTDEARRLFGRGADLFCEGRYGEALSVFDSLVRRFPNIPEIEKARRQCLAARTRGPMALPMPEGATPITPKADPATVKEFVLQKMFYAKSEEVQLQAAELMGKILGMLPAQPQSAAPPQAGTQPPEARGGETEAAAEEDIADSTHVSFSDFAADPNRKRAR